MATGWKAQLIVETWPRDGAITTSIENRSVHDYIYADARKKIRTFSDESTATIRAFDGGDESVWVVVQMAWRQTEDMWRLMDRVAVITVAF
ncbi:uncharacterized protein G2W53_026773 [Senna tora]|uniref:Uncharacterized protein n=1 Tax=Senna tora TaxID=362788 RepID=A0A834TFW1_9FABA|nr:uncharacterized protein G2W53_026773 [Senna tora]